MVLSESSYNEMVEALKLHLKDHPKRFTHIMGVVKMSEYLAKRYNVDVLKAKIAALLHDWSKYEDNDLSPLTPEKREYAKKYPYLAHALLSRVAAEKVFKIDDEDILNAIENHVVGRCGMSLLEEIVFISDFTEEGRVYDDCIKCRDILINKGINEAILFSCESSIAHSESAHPNQLELIKIYKEKK